MGILDRKHTRRRPPNDGSGSDDFGLDLADLRAEVPEVDETMNDIERALREPMTQTEKRGCGCWG